MRKFLVLFSAVILVLALSSLMPAQERFGNIAGTVADISGAVVPDATITVINKATNRTFTTKSRADGTFLAPEMEPGHYTVAVEKTGFSRFEVPDVTVLVGKNSNITVAMKVGSTTETVEVSAAATVIDTSSTMVAHNVTSDELDTLPKGRDFTGVAIFSPSVNTGQIEGGYQINGASGAENSYYIDGVATNSMIDGSARQSATFDYIQEVQVKTTGLDAEYGGALGGVVSAITRSGGNAFHGDIHYYYFGNKLGAGPVERMQIEPDSRTSFKYIQDAKDKNDNFELGGTFGGPIIQNRLFFFTAASPRWQKRSRDYTFADGPGQMKASTNQMNWFNKISFEPASRVRMNFTWLYTPTSATGIISGYNGYEANTRTNTTEDARTNSYLGFFQPEQSYTGQVDYTPTNTTVISVKGGRYYLNYKDTGVLSQGEYWYNTSPTGVTSAVAPGAGVPEALWLASNYQSPAGGQTVHDLTTRTYIQADISQIARFAGQHSFKFGIGTAKNVNNANVSDYGPNGRVVLFWNSMKLSNPNDPNSALVYTPNLCVPCGATTTGKYGYYGVNEGGTIGSAGSNINNFYVQDSWKVHSRLTLNVGVRFEKETIPSFRPDIKKYAMQFGYGDKIAPRIGGSYDLFGNGKVKLSAGWGRFYDWTKYDLARGTFGGATWRVYYRTLGTELETNGVLDPNKVWALNLNNMPGTNLWPGAYRDRRLPGFDTLDPNVKPMSSDTIHTGVEWELADKLVFTGRYVRNKLNRTIEDMGVLVNGDESYFYGNPGEGQNRFAPASGASCPETVDGKCAVPMPKAKRTYDAMELSLSRRFSHGYLFDFSYVYSRLYGNYSGLQSTDEIRPPTLGYSSPGNQSFFGQLFRSGGNANRYFDLDEAYYDANGNNGLYGALPTDRPHVLKFYGSKKFRFGTEVGTFFRGSSGTPMSTQVNTKNGIPVYVNGRGDMGRTPFFTQTDLMVAHVFKLGKSESQSLRFEFNMINLFNQKTNVYTYDRYNQEEQSDSIGIDLANVDLTRGFDWKSMVAAKGGLDPRYGKAAVFNPGFQGRLLIKYTF